MSLDQRTHYLVHCDLCGCGLGQWDAALFAPQDVLAMAASRYGWHVDGEITFCGGCPHPGDEPPEPINQPCVEHQWNFVAYSNDVVCDHCGVRHGDL